MSNKFKKEHESEYSHRVIMVSRVAAGGRKLSFSAHVVVGNRYGIVGFGSGNGKEVGVATTKAIENAKKNLMNVPLKVRGKHVTFYYGFAYKFRSTTLILGPSKSGEGRKTSNVVKQVLDLLGVTDAAGKVHGSTNPHVVLATLKYAFKKIEHPKFIAQKRNKSLKEMMNETNNRIAA